MTTDSLGLMESRPQAAGERAKVMFLETASATGGVQHTTLYLVEHLDRARWQPLVVCPEEGDLTRACQAAGVEVRILPRPPLWSPSFWISNRKKLPNPLAWLWDVGAILLAARRVRSLLDQERPDLVVTKGLLCHFYGGLAARRAGIPCIWHVQDFISNRFGGIYRGVFECLSAALASRLIAIGSPILGQFPVGVREKTSVVHNGINLKTFRQRGNGIDFRREFGIGPGELVIGNVARLTPWKGQDLLLDAFAQVVHEVPARLLVVGAPLFESAGYEQRLRAKAAELGLSDCVIFTGHRTDIPQVLAAMDIFAYTAVEKDVWPLSLLQAMASALPVVAFDLEGVREPIGSDDNAILVPVSRVALFARALRELAVSADLRRRLGDAARRRAEEAFSVERYVAQMEAAFFETLV